MSLREVSVTVQRPARTGDGSGGFTIAWAPVAGMIDIPATHNFYGRTSELAHEEQAAHNTQGPGLEIRKQQLFVFRQQPAPDIRTQDRIVTSDGLQYVVQFPRLYDRTLQVDCEIIQ